MLFRLRRWRPPIPRTTNPSYTTRSEYLMYRRFPMAAFESVATSQQHLILCDVQWQQVQSMEARRHLPVEVSSIQSAKHMITTYAVRRSTQDEKATSPTTPLETSSTRIRLAFSGTVVSIRSRVRLRSIMFSLTAVINRVVSSEKKDSRAQDSPPTPSVFASTLSCHRSPGITRGASGQATTHAAPASGVFAMIQRSPLSGSYRRHS